MASVGIEVADILRAAKYEGIRFGLNAKSRAVEQPVPRLARYG